MKAYRTPEGKVVLFRPEKNMARLNLSNDRLCIPLIDEAFGVEAVKKLVEIDQAWIPSGEGTALYIRPFIIAVDPHVGGASSSSFAVHHHPVPSGRLLSRGD